MALVFNTRALSKANGALYVAGSYLNWGLVSGTNGYGLRDYSGQLQFKDSGGTWTAFNTGAATNFWKRTGTVLDMATAGDTLSIASAGPHAFGTSAAGNVRFRIGGNYTSTVTSTATMGQYFYGIITALPGTTGYMAGTFINNAFTTGGAGETIPLITQMYAGEPQITIIGLDVVTESATVYIASAATEATRNYSLLNDSATLSRFDGPIVVGNPNLSAFVTTGISLRQGSADNYILTSHSGDVAHVMTDKIDADGYFGLLKYGSTTGGAALRGFSKTYVGVSIGGYVTTEDALRSTSALAAVMVRGFTASGTTAGDMSVGKNIFVIRNNETTAWICGVGGEVWQPGSLTTNLGLQTAGANDSAGAGYRLVRVPNV